MAGAGVPGGAVLGRTDEEGGRATARRVHDRRHRRDDLHEARHPARPDHDHPRRPPDPPERRPRRSASGCDCSVPAHGGPHLPAPAAALSPHRVRGLGGRAPRLPAVARLANVPSDVKLGRCPPSRPTRADRVLRRHTAARSRSSSSTATASSSAPGATSTSRPPTACGSTPTERLGHRHRQPPGDEVRPRGKLLLSLGKKGEAGRRRPTSSTGRPTWRSRPPASSTSPTGTATPACSSSPATASCSSSGARRATGEGEFNLPHAICLDAKGRVYVGDRENNRVQVFDADGKFLDQWKESGAPYGLFLAGRPAVRGGRPGGLGQGARPGREAARPVRREGDRGRASSRCRTCCASIPAATCTSPR